MPVDRGKPRLFHRATEWSVFNPEGMEDFFHGQLEVRGEKELAGMGLKTSRGQRGERGEQQGGAALF